MSTIRSALLDILFDGQFVREPYIDLVRSLIETEFEISKSYLFFDGSIKREGVAYILGNQEVYWIDCSESKPRLLIVRSELLRNNILDLLALHPLYTKWFGLLI